MSEPAEVSDWSVEPEGGYIVSAPRHWRVTYDANDGEPIGEICTCEIGEDHKGNGEVTG